MKKLFVSTFAITPLIFSVLIPSISNAQQADTAPAGSNSCAVLTNNVGYGTTDANTSGGNAVSILQDFLSVHGYLNTSPTGFFGHLTMSAVESFQSANGISPTGYVGPLTRAKIQSIDCNGSSATNGNSTQPTASSGSQTATTAPSCSLTSDKASYSLGGTITFSWTSKNATYAAWQPDTSGKDFLNLPGDKLSANGSQTVTANVVGNPSATLLVGSTNGTATCTDTVNVSNSVSTVSPTPVGSATINQNGLIVLPNTGFNLSGNTSVLSGSLTVAIVGPGYSGSTDWNTIGNLLKGQSSYVVFANSAQVQALANAQAYQVWSASFGGIAGQGSYTVLVYDASGNLLTTGTLMVTYKG